MDPISNPVIAKKQSYVVVLSKLEGERADLNNPVAAPASKLEGERVDLNNPVAAPASKDDGDKSVEIISYGHMFSPYKSHLQREFSEEDRTFEAQRKRYKRLSEWKWSQVINLDDSKEDDKEEELEDTTDSSSKKKTELKIPQVSIQKRNRFHSA
ncbi:hypothetical protein HanRHA438_Chr11g0504601 [Helianthus annuus]|uniref:Uncharacterized protein n=1 Tax=Helianthus annuus TaxID=4232 RepID=A0A9K3HQ27_HELAN|nr:hypothetical protein HanXRQr2_Chr11g0491911 [Helianthus annuus]KAJ0509509.1 hypothetical protein HanIR_Chr11g0529631 [Helianthus annuus]KAJ0517561.1 hypothetical protein HanHA89_Chr11g0426741 [Helianthus annuus]KAJ0638439.1 hypothetical protein HanHA300_Chr00c0119g0712981 [Helianthus annuus]KAJ0685571.1 hypothetical protein HanLR1_Chr11g0404181 [Helianthus annuus]